MSDVGEVDAAKEECLKKIWEKDKLGRRADADYLIHFLIRRMEERGKGEKSYVLNIDAAWGGGKSFFLERFGQQLEAENHLVTYVNAWADDHIEDPQIAVMAAIEAKMDATLMKDDPLRKDWKEVKRHALPIAGALVAATETVIGSPFRKGRKTFDRMMQNSITAIEVVVQEKKAVENFKKAFSKFLGKLNKSRKLPFFILVDEMDRCRPPYAIALLERVKHLFDIDNVVFVFATDTEQLSHSIGAVYGAGFASRKYLQRFFDQTYSFEEPKLEKYVEFLVDKHQLDEANIMWEHSHRRNSSFHLATCFQAFELDLRSVGHCIEILSNIATVWEYNQIPIKGIVLVPMIIAYHQNRKELHFSNDKIRELYKEGMKNAYQWRVNTPSGDIIWLELLTTYQEVIASLRQANGLANLENNHTAHLLRKPSDSKSKRYLWIIEQIKFEQSESLKIPHMARKTIVEIYPEIVRSAGRFAQLTS